MAARSRRIVRLGPSLGGGVVFGVVFAIGTYFLRDRDLGWALGSGMLTAAVWCSVSLLLTRARWGGDSVSDRTN